MRTVTAWLGGFAASSLLFGGFVLGLFVGQSQAADSKSAGKEIAGSELSVAPIGAPMTTQYPPDRPEWIANPPKVEGQAHLAVSSGPWSTRREAERELAVQLKKQVDAYINDFVGNSNAAALIGYDLETIQREFASPDPKHSYSGKLVSPTVGEMQEEARLLVIDQQDQKNIDERWRAVVATSRLASTGLVVAGVLGLLMVAYGFMKADTATRGFYTGRLQLLSLMVVAAMIAIGVFIARAIPWM
jgi:hypothetical protein